MNKEKKMRRLVIKTFPIDKVEFADETSIKNNTLYIKKNIMDIVDVKRDLIKKVDLNIIKPNEKDVFINSIMDFSPVAVKVLGRIGEGITHVLTGICVMLTGVDENGIQVAEFGSSEGILKDQARDIPDYDVLMKQRLRILDEHGLKLRDIQEVIAEGDRIVVVENYSGTMTGELKGLEPNGRKMSVTAVDIYRTKDGKLTEVLSVLDTASVMEQLGLMD